MNEYYLNQETGRREKWTPREPQGKCGCSGMIESGAICGSVQVGGEVCLSRDDTCTYLIKPESDNA